MRNKIIVDVVNFNADASCLSSKTWLAMLEGGNKSLLVQWLKLYVEFDKKIVLGFTGASIADISSFNPEAIALINERPDIFEIVLRPFAHDIALLRQGKGFSINAEYGRKVIYKEFHKICDSFLPPEFMLTNGQLALLSNCRVHGVFINSARFSPEIQNKIPDTPYQMRGLLGTTMNCIPLIGELTESYLHALQLYDCSLWNDKISASQPETLFLWRDGESSFLLPNGLAREGFWLQNEGKHFDRNHITSLDVNYIPSERLDENYFTSYPVHSFSAWMKEFRMLGFLNNVSKIENSLEQLTRRQISAWLMIINSDILSAIEKGSPIVQLKDQPDARNIYSHTIQRSDRGFEGEEYLAILECLLIRDEPPEYINRSELPHMRKWRARIDYLSSILDDDEFRNGAADNFARQRDPAARNAMRSS